MRTAILAAALGLAALIPAANAAPANQQQAQTAQNSCPAGFHWSPEHYDRHMTFWTGSCIPNGR